MFENIMNFFKNWNKKGDKAAVNSKNAAKERLHLVLMQDRANVSADFLELMKQEIIEVIKKYIDVDESAIDVRLTNKENGDGTNGAPALYANIPIVNIKNETRQIEVKEKSETKNQNTVQESKKEANNEVAQKVEQAEEIIEEVKGNEKKEEQASKKEGTEKKEIKKSEKKKTETKVKEKIKSEKE